MAQRPLKIPMDKSRQPKLGITVRDGDAKGVLDVTLLGPNNAPYDLTDKQVVFREEKENNKWIEDSTNINIDDAPRGHFTYVLHQQAQVIGNGRAWFKVISSDGTIDSSQDFYITVEKGFNMAITNSNYISEFEDIRKKLNSIETDADTSYKAELQSLKDRGNKAIDDVEAAYQKAASGFQTAFNTAESNRKTADDNAEQARQTEYESDKKTRDDTYSADKQKRDSDWSTSLNDIKKAASDEQTAIQKAADKQSTDNQSAWDTQKQKLLDDWDKTQQGFNTTLDGLKTTVNGLQTTVDQLNQADLPNAQQKMDALEAEIKKAEQTFSQVDFSKFVTGDQFKAVQDTLATKVDKADFDTKLAHYYDKTAVDSKLADKANTAAVYTKTELDAKLAEAGKVKTVSLNGGNKVVPDSNGNIDLTVPQPDLSDYAKTADVAEQFTTVNNQIKELQSRQSTFTPITQAEYDALPEAEKANGMYAIGDSN